jgi:hypothetical protein
MPQRITPNQPINQDPGSISLEEENRKALARKRIFWAVVVIDFLIGGVLVYEIFKLFY